MYSIQRQSQILEMLEKEGQVDVNSLACNFETSRETIRRDLKGLETSGLLKRTHGGAVQSLGDYSKGYEFPLFARNIQKFHEKQQICKAAASLIEDGDTLFIDNSSTTMNFLQYLPQTKRITAVTNSIQVMLTTTRLKNNISVIGLGGNFNEKNFSVSGLLSNQFAKYFFPDKAIISCRGVNPKDGMTDGSFLEVEVKRIMLDNSREIILLVDHTKFGMTGVIRFGDIEEIDYVVTDSFTNKEQLQIFEGCEAQIIMAEPGYV